MVAGLNILYLPGTFVGLGGYMDGYIVSDTASWCVTPPKVALVTGTNQNQQGMKQLFYRIYPNPTSGAFTIELTDPLAFGKSLIEIYGMKGEKLMSYELTGEQKHEFSIAGKPAGIYLVRIISEQNSGTTRLFKQ